MGRKNKILHPEDILQHGSANVGVAKGEKKGGGAKGKKKMKAIFVLITPTPARARKTKTIEDRPRSGPFGSLRPVWTINNISSFLRFNHSVTAGHFRPDCRELLARKHEEAGAWCAAVNFLTTLTWNGTPPGVSGRAAEIWRFG